MAELTLSGAALYEFMTAFFTTGPGCKIKIQCPGTSMSPFIRNNSTLTLAPFISSRKPGFGDIVIAAAHVQKKILIHRVITASPPWYLIKGDNNKRSDGWFHQKNILGFVEKIEHNNKQHIPRPWQNVLIGAASKTGILNHILLPAARCIKQWTP